jgi:hypothetical protein
MILIIYHSGSAENCSPSEILPRERHPCKVRKKIGGQCELSRATPAFSVADTDVMSSLLESSRGLMVIRRVSRRLGSPALDLGHHDQHMATGTSHEHEPFEFNQNKTPN